MADTVPFDTPFPDIIDKFGGGVFNLVRPLLGLNQLEFQSGAPDLFGSQSQNNSNDGKTGSPIDETGRGGDPTLGLSETDFQNFTNLINSFNTERDRNTGIVNDAIGRLDNLSGNIGNIFDTQINDVRSALPLNPFSNDIRNTLLNNANDTITQLSSETARRRNTALADRGLSSGGTTGRAIGADLFSREAGARSDVRAQTLESQLAFNEASNRARETLINQLTGAKASSINRTGDLASTLRASDRTDPSTIPGLLESFITREQDAAQRNDILGVIKELGQSSFQRDLVNQLFGIITSRFAGPFGQALGNLGATAINGPADFTSFGGFS